jgi:hypothetical protein
MRVLSGIVMAMLFTPVVVQANEATEQKNLNKPAVRGSIIGNMLQNYDNPFTLYPYETNYLLYTDTSDLNKEAIKSYNWAENARKDEVKFQLSLAFPIWRGIAGENSVLGHLTPNVPGGSFLTTTNPHRSVKPTTNRKFLSAGPRRISLPAGRCVISKWV